MVSRGLIKLLPALAALLAALPVQADTTVQLRVMETTDLHMYVVDYDYYQDVADPRYGLARTATLIRKARAEVHNSVLVDNGDLLQGNPLGDFVARQRGLDEGEVHPVYKAMNLLDYDVGNIGNHEFNYGLEFLRRSLAGANFPYISANVFHDDGDDDAGNDEPYFDQYLIIDKTMVAEDGGLHPIRIGFIGFVPPQIMMWDRSNLTGEVVAHDMVETAERLVPRMRAKGADVIVAIPHSGIATVAPEGMDEHATYYLSQVDGIDAILFGHSHRVFPGEFFAGVDGVDIERGTINGVPSTMPGAWGSHLGYVDLELVVSDAGEWTIVGGIGVVRPIYALEDGKPVELAEPAEDILMAVADDHAATIDYVRTGVGRISAPINSYFALVRDDPSVQIVTDAQKHYIRRLLDGSEYDGLPILSASAPFKAGGRGGDGYFTEIEAGEIALKDVADLYIYPNTVRAVLITGAEVREWLEMAAGVFNRVDPDDTAEQELVTGEFPSYNFDVIDGVTYQIDVSQPARYTLDGALVNPASRRIVGLAYEGELVADDQQFVVVTNNYRADGGGQFPGLDGSKTIIAAPDTNRSVVAAYVLEREVIDPTADGNWSFAPINDDVLVTFSSAPEGESTLSADSPISKLSVNENGSVKYRIEF